MAVGADELAELWHSLSDVERAVQATGDRLAGRLDALDARLSTLQAKLDSLARSLVVVVERLRRDDPPEPWQQ